MVIGLNRHMDHNKQEYIKFLSAIKRLKFHYICCKWRKIVEEQLIELKIEEGPVSTKQRSIDTNVTSLNDQGIKTNGNELSMVTVT